MKLPFGLQPPPGKPRPTATATGDASPPPLAEAAVRALPDANVHADKPPRFDSLSTSTASSSNSSSRASLPHTASLCEPRSPKHAPLHTPLLHDPLAQHHQLQQLLPPQLPLQHKQPADLRAPADIVPPTAIAAEPDTLSQPQQQQQQQKQQQQQLQQQQQQKQQQQKQISAAALAHQQTLAEQARKHSPNTVFLNVYDVQIPSDPATIPRINDVLVHCGIGIFHTGIQVWGREFAFGGHPDPDTGIFEVTPRQCPAVRYRSTLILGETHLSERQIDRLIVMLGKAEYIGCRYSLISRNCNTFSQHLAFLLDVKDKFPAWVNRLAGIAVNIRCILPEAIEHPLGDLVPNPPLLKEPQKPPPVAIL